MTTTTPFPLYGTISHGTLRTEDLVPTFLNALNFLDERAEFQLVLDNLDVIAMLDVIGLHEMSEASADRVDMLLSDLFDALDACAPAGFYFGAIEGDGSDFGFWRVEDDDDYEDEEPREHDPYRDDVEADAATLASVGWGTDEDYGMYDSGDLW